MLEGLLRRRVLVGLKWLSLALLAIVHGGAYADLLPPWGMFDEEQHIHYIQYLTEHGVAPTVGEVYLSPEVVEGLFRAKRWENFHWASPPSHDPREMGLEGHSYEGYQPPLFYILAAPVYLAVPGDIISKLYAIRWEVVGLSLLSVWMAYRWASELFPGHNAIPFFTALILVLIPERAAAVSRVNNDVLLEVLSMAFIWAYTRAMLKGLSIRRSLTIGALLGLGVLSKVAMGLLAALLPFLFWVNRRDRWRHMLLIGGVAGSLMLPLLLRNLWLYGDLTGFSSFAKLNAVFIVIRPPEATCRGVLVAVRDMFCHLWVIWWKGAVAAKTPVVSVMQMLLAVISLVGLWRAGREIKRGGRTGVVALSYVSVILLYAAAVLVAYFEGSIPVVQGRFFLPVGGPMVLLLVWGLWRHPYGRALLSFTVGLLMVLGVLSLFGNLLPFFYYWSEFVDNGVLKPYSHPGLWEAGEIFLRRFVWSKPRLVLATAMVVVGLYAPTMALAGGVSVLELCAPALKRTE